MRKGAGFYSRALSALRKQLQHPVLILRDDVLVSIICMAIYELVTLHQPNGWLHHYRGLAHLVRLVTSILSGAGAGLLTSEQIAIRGPQRHQSGVGFFMLPILRSCIVRNHFLSSYL